MQQDLTRKIDAVNADKGSSNWANLFEKNRLASHEISNARQHQDDQLFEKPKRGKRLQKVVQKWVSKGLKPTTDVVHQPQKEPQELIDVPIQEKQVTGEEHMRNISKDKGTGNSIDFRIEDFSPLQPTPL
ncbi:hypothetical protein HAX54_022168 [Datura stramonium]|uniref:Uncharacterized protein n=1 Tax=Datura stramonium TaxID=4076 RepID=A0ABS8Y6D4_DATST|nr:hypothetical protein [Datura stramonium]